MKHLKTFFLGSALLCSAVCMAQTQKKTTHIIGEVNGYRPVSITLTRVEDDKRVNEGHEIPFRDGRFTFDYTSDKPEVLQLVVYLGDGSGRYTEFFAEGDTVQVKFYAGEVPEMLSSSPLNKQQQQADEEIYSTLRPLGKKLRKMEKDGLDMTPEAQQLKKKILEARENNSPDSIVLPLIEEARRMDEEGRMYTPEYRETEKLYGEAYRQSFIDQREYARNHPDPVGLYNLYYAAERCKEGEDKEIIDIYQSVFDGKLPDFHLSDYMNIWCASRQIRVGGTFYDFTAPDPDGNDHRLSEEINGKIALIDLWASWCGPCRRKAKSMIPVYEEYKDKGFTIVGVARENKADDMRIALEHDKYPWLNLLELRDRAKIWRHYGAGNAGGKTILVDKDGTILAIEPDADEVKSILETKLKQ